MKTPRMVIVDGVRTPFCRAGSDLAGLAADELGRIAVNALLTGTGIDPSCIDEVIFGCVCQPFDAANIARVIALRAGIPESVPARYALASCRFRCGCRKASFRALTTVIAAARSRVPRLFCLPVSQSST